jgi:hypothetical protein
MSKKDVLKRKKLQETQNLEEKLPYEEKLGPPLKFNH